MFDTKGEAWEAFKKDCPWKQPDNKCMAQLDSGAMGLRWNRQCEKDNCALWYLFAVFPFGDYE